MLQRTITPLAPLSEFVGLLWFSEGYAPQHPKERLLPSGTVELIINLRDEGSAGGALVCGAHSRFFEIDTAAEACVIGVHFKPGGAFPFFAPPMGELQNVHVALADLWGNRSTELRDRLFATNCPDLQLRILEEFLLSSLVHRLERHRAVEFALRAFAHTRAGTVSAVSAQTGLSQRRFIELFKAEVGLTPKLFWRVRRFHEIVRRAHLGPEIDWARMAAETGYFDQAHFIHDFREFSGLTPSAYLAARTAHTNHVRVES